MLDKSINAALVELRKRMARGGADLTHIHAVMASRGLDPASIRVPRQYPSRLRRNLLKAMVMDALRSGPMTGPEITALTMASIRQEKCRNVYQRTYAALGWLVRHGVAVREGGRWRLARTIQVTLIK